MDTKPYPFVRDLLAEAPVPERGILSQVLSREDGVEFSLFAFAPGEALSEHTSSRPAIIHVLRGDADIVLNGDAHEGTAGTWLHMAAGTPHSIAARTPLVMALYLLPRPAPDARAGA